MSQTLQFEIDPLRISSDVVGSVLVAIDVLAYSREDYPLPGPPVCVIAAAHTNNLSSISKAYTKLYIAGSPSAAEEKLILREFTAYLDMFDGGTLAAGTMRCGNPVETTCGGSSGCRSFRESPAASATVERSSGSSSSSSGSMGGSSGSMGSSSQGSQSGWSGRMSATGRIKSWSRWKGASALSRAAASATSVRRLRECAGFYGISGA